MKKKKTGRDAPRHDKREEMLVGESVLRWSSKEASWRPQFCASSSSEKMNVLSEDGFCALSSGLRTWRGEGGAAVRLEKREDDDEGRLKLRTPGGTGEAAKWVRGGGSGWEWGKSWAAGLSAFPLKLS